MIAKMICRKLWNAWGHSKKENYRMEIMPYLTGPELIREYEIGRRFNLLVLDMYMEPINGIETAKQIRKIDTTVPIFNCYIYDRVCIGRLFSKCLQVFTETDR